MPSTTHHLGACWDEFTGTSLVGSGPRGRHAGPLGGMTDQRHVRMSAAHAMCAF